MVSSMTRTTIEVQFGRVRPALHVDIIVHQVSSAHQASNRFGSKLSPNMEKHHIDDKILFIKFHHAIFWWDEVDKHP